jgi:hypothetical protein
MRLSRVLRKPAVTAGALGATLLVSLLVIPAGTAAGRVAFGSQASLGCSRPVPPPRGLPAALKGWYSKRNKYITGRIGLDERALAREGVELTQWGPDPCSGKVKIYLTHYSRAAARVLVSRYGGDVIVSRHSMPRPFLRNRSDDQSPFSAGDFILLPNAGEECTGGPIVEGNTNNAFYMLTAGHCDQRVGDPVYRSDRSGGTGGPEMGVINVTSFCNFCYDTAQIKSDSTGASYIADVWGSPSGTSYEEDGSCFPQPGDDVTSDGAFSDEHGGIVVDAVNQNVVVAPSGNTIIDTTEADFVIVNGDSGGPWFQHIGGTNEVCTVGTSVASNSTDSWYEQIGHIDLFLNTFVPTS